MIPEWPVFLKNWHRENILGRFGDASDDFEYWENQLIKQDYRKLIGEYVSLIKKSYPEVWTWNVSGSGTTY